MNTYKIAEIWYPKTEAEYTLEEMAESRLMNYSFGAIEVAQATAKNVAQAYGRLLDLLVEKKTITAAQAVALIDNGCKLV